MATNNVHILLNNVVDSSTLSSGSWNASYPRDNVKNDDIRVTARTTNLTFANTVISVDAGAARKWNCAALGAHNLSTAATWRVIFTDDAADTVGNRIYDTGAMNVWTAKSSVTTVEWGAIPDITAGTSAFTGAYPNNAWSIHFTPNDITARYCFIRIGDSTNAAGYVEIGRFMAGLAWSPAINVDYNASIRWVDPSDARRTKGGRRLVQRYTPYRVAEVNFNNLTSDEAWSAVNELQRLGKEKHVLFVMNPNDASHVMFQRSFYGQLSDTSPISQTTFDTLSSQITVEEQN